MDPVTALSVAMSALQLTEYAITAAKSLAEIKKRGSTAENATLQRETQSLAEASSSLTAHLGNLQSNKGLSADQERLRTVAESCGRSSGVLLDQLYDITGSTSVRKRDALSIWFKSAKRKSSLARIQSELRRDQEILNTDMLTNICRGVDVIDTKHADLLLKIEQLRNSNNYTTLNRDLQSLVLNVQQRLLNDGSATRDLISLTHSDQVNRQRLQLLDSLKDDSLNARQDVIDDACQETLEWLFEPEKVDSPETAWDNFPDWLQSNDRIYWFQGKAGSGKSTLMNFIAEHDKLLQGLRPWCKDRKLLLLKFFFWRAGTPQQKSLIGLLRAILYQILSAEPTLTSLICKDGFHTGPAWTEKRLIKALEIVLDNTKHVRYCLIVDGLDEFEGAVDRQRSLVKFIYDFTRHDNAKAIVSSRPEPVLFQSFSTYPNLCLQALNWRDIETCVRTRILEESWVQEFEPTAVSELIKDVTYKADGVFLWASIAVQDLLQGIAMLDSIETLRQRLDHLDGSLNGLFTQQLQRIQPVHRKRAATHLAFVADGVSTTLEYVQMTVGRIAFSLYPEISKALHRVIESEQYLEKDVQYLSAEIEKLEASLMWQSAGLLDVKSDRCAPAHTKLELSKMLCVEGQDAFTRTQSAFLSRFCLHYFYHTRVQLVHRSVVEYLSDDLRAKQFMTEAQLPDASIFETVLRGLQGITSVDFYLLREYCRIDALSAVSQTWIIDPFTLTRRLVDEQNNFYAMMTHLFGLLRGTDVETRTERLQSTRVWFENVASPLSKLVPCRWALNSSVFRGLDRMPLSCIFTRHMIRLGAAEIIDINLSCESLATLEYFFDAALHRLDRLMSRRVEPLLRAEPNLRIIEQCLAHGLDPNARSINSKYFGLSFLSNSLQNTAWEEYLELLRGFLKYSWQKCFSEADAGEMARDLLSVANVFITHGANHFSPVWYPILVDWSSVSIFAHDSTLNLLSDLRTIAGLEQSEVVDHLTRVGRADHLRIDAIIWMRDGGRGYDFLIAIPEKEQAALLPYFKSYMDLEGSTPFDNPELQRRTETLKKFLKPMLERNKLSIRLNSDSLSQDEFGSILRPRRLRGVNKAYDPKQRSTSTSVIEREEATDATNSRRRQSI